MHLVPGRLEAIPTYRYVRCLDCRLARIASMPTAEELEAIYGAPAYHRIEGVAGRLLDRIMPLYYSLTRPLPRGSGKRLLDIGASSGLFLDYARSRGWEIDGTEVSNEARSLAWTERRLRISPEEALESWEDARFDRISMFHVLEHVASPRRLLERTSRLLRHGGRMTIQIPVLDSLEFDLFGAETVWIGAPQHIHMFTEATFGQLATRSRLRVTNVRGDWISPHLFSWSLLFALERRIGFATGMGVKKLAALLAIPLGLPINAFACALGRSAFKTFTLARADA
jgi:SAM-dependent methyltransferase